MSYLRGKKRAQRRSLPGAEAGGHWAEWNAPYTQMQLKFAFEPWRTAGLRVEQPKLVPSSANHGRAAFWGAKIPSP